MKILVEIEGTTYEGSLPYMGCEMVSVSADCPICSTRLALINPSNERILALASQEKLSEAKTAFPNAKVVQAPLPKSLRVRMPSYRQDSHGYVGTAECGRCRQTIGKMAVEMDTLFGLEEDRAVLEGRYRVF